MTEISPHNKLITKIAKARFKQADIKQKGQSRTFLQDHFWFTILIEFQPSGFDKGTYLNVGADFNFYPREHFAFSLGYRENKFVKFIDEVQFEVEINKLCDLAIKRTSEIKMQLDNYSSATTTLKKELSENIDWLNFDFAIITALSGDEKNAKILLEALVKEECDTSWQKERLVFSNKLIQWLESGNFIESMNKQIVLTRKLKKLDK